MAGPLALEPPVEELVEASEVPPVEPEAGPSPPSPATGPVDDAGAPPAPSAPVRDEAPGLVQLPASTSWNPALLGRRQLAEAVEADRVRVATLGGDGALVPER